MLRHEEHKGHPDDELYGVFLHGTWVMHAPVFREKQAAESWLTARKPPDGYKGAVVKGLGAEARELRKKAAKVLVDAKRESDRLLAAEYPDDDLYHLFIKGRLVEDAPVFTEKQTAEIWLLMQKPQDYKGAAFKSLRSDAKGQFKRAAKALVTAEKESVRLLAVARQLDAVPLPGTNFVGVELVRPKADKSSYSSFGREKNTSVVSGGLPGLGKKR
ncbi:hypothetical protein [Robbsia andropogonis]|uniref:hypothetical protein n=1 Tax=Robbsia andropogonis TaxID=28092 RepID=UPI0012FA32D0|nr:hypothetical protein [Robbsia andropogonis]